MTPLDSTKQQILADLSRGQSVAYFLALGPTHARWKAGAIRALLSAGAIVKSGEQRRMRTAKRGGMGRAQRLPIYSLAQ